MNRTYFGLFGSPDFCAANRRLLYPAMLRGFQIHKISAAVGVLAGVVGQEFWLFRDPFPVDYLRILSAYTNGVEGSRTKCLEANQAFRSLR